MGQSCAYRLEHYWTYELCHGKHIRQYHEERDGTKIKVSFWALNFVQDCLKSEGFVGTLGVFELCFRQGWIKSLPSPITLLRVLWDSILR